MDLLTLALLLCPIETPVPHYAPPASWQSLKRVARVLELVGPEERWAESYRNELAYVRRHLDELRDAPPIAEASRFEPADATRSWLCYRIEALEYRRAAQLHRRDELTEEIQHTQNLRAVWDALAEAQLEDRSWVIRRRALLRLREQLGLGDWFAGEMPRP